MSTPVDQRPPEFTVRDIHKAFKALMSKDLAAAEAVILYPVDDTASSGPESYLQPVSSIRGVWWHPDTNEVIEAKDCVNLKSDPREDGFVSAIILS